MNRGRELLVGTVILIALAVVVVGTLWLQGKTFGPVRTASALSESVGQLALGNVVTYRGVRIGQVSRIQVLPDGSGVEVTMTFERDVPLPEDAGVVFGPASLFADWQAEIVSRATYPRYAFYEVPANTTAPPPVFGGYALPEISRLTASAEEISNNLAALSDRLELAFNDQTASSLATAIGNIQTITDEVRRLVEEESGVAKSISSSADSALAEIETASAAARRSFERLEGVLDEAQIDSLVTDIRMASQSIRLASSQLADSTSGVASTLARADSAFASLDRIANRIESGQGALGRLVVDTTLSAKAEDVLSQLDTLLQDLRENPRRYVRLSIF
jgi:phospholipid/cholesterol/gamma-HCH transport system substrate-binding protein